MACLHHPPSPRPPGPGTARALSTSAPPTGRRHTPARCPRLAPGTTGARGSSSRHLTRQEPGCLRWLRFPGELARVDPDHIAAGGHRKPRRELADQPKAEHHHFGARPDPGQAKRVQRDGCQSGECRVLRRHLFWHHRAQQVRNGLELGVVGLAGTTRGYHLAGRDPVDGRTDLDGHPGCGVAEGQVVGESRFGPRAPWLGCPRACALRTTWRTRSGRARALASRLDLASSVIARSVPTEITEAAVRTSTSTGLITGTWDVEHLDGAAVHRLHDLFQVSSFPPARSRARVQEVLILSRQ